MGYYTRILSPSTCVVSVSELQEFLDSQSFDASVSVEGGSPEDWTNLILAHRGGQEIAEIERNPVASDTLGEDELQEFLDDIADCRPLTAVQWLSNYFRTVKTIYAFRWLSGTEVKNGSTILGTVMHALQNALGGVIQADGEGFSDDEGCDHILWQFNDGVKGRWRMAVFQDGHWVRFEMELGNRKHREAFFRGEVPSGVDVLN